MLEIKREQEPIYFFNSETTPREYGRMVKYFPKYYWLNVRNATILNLGIIGLSSLFANYSKSGLISLFIFLEIKLCSEN